MHVEQSQGVDTVLCKHKRAFTLGLFTGDAAARNNFGGPRVNNIKGHFKGHSQTCIRRILLSRILAQLGHNSDL